MRVKVNDDLVTTNKINGVLFYVVSQLLVNILKLKIYSTCNKIFLFLAVIWNYNKTFRVVNEMKIIFPDALCKKGYEMFFF